MAKIGFIGVGNMGSRMCARLMQSGQDCLVYDLYQPAVDDLVTQGATAAADLSQFQSCEVIFTMLQTGQQVHETLTPIFQSAQKNTLFIDCSSIDIKTTRQLHTDAKAQRLRFLDAPVSGGIAGAEQGALTIMVGGEQQTCQQAQCFLEPLAKKIVYAGAAGCGQAAKMCNNMVLGVSMIAISEAFNLAKTLGLAPEKLFEICSTASGQCWALTSYCPEPDILEGVPANNNYKPGFTAQMMLKDLNLGQSAAADFSVNTPMGQQAQQLFDKMVQEGRGDLDFSAIIKELSK